MALTVTDQVMRSTDTPHNACRLPTEANPDADVWAVSWLPKRRLTRDQAVTAMTIAEEVGRISAAAGPEAYDGKFWALIDSLAAELGLTGPDAVARASESPS
jgi:hypothetical protein